MLIGSDLSYNRRSKVSIDRLFHSFYMGTHFYVLDFVVYVIFGVENRSAYGVNLIFDRDF
jgi:hypothetical protein